MLSPEKYKQLTDHELILRYKESGELAVVGELYSRYMSLVFRGLP